MNQFVPEQGVVTNSPLNPNHPSSTAYEGELELMAAPTAWRSLPGVIRFAVWLWALATVIGAVVGVAAGAGMLTGTGDVMSAEDISISVRNKIAEWYGAEYNVAEDEFLETDDTGTLEDQDTGAMDAYRGARFALEAVEAAVHETYVNAQRAVAAITWQGQGVDPSHLQGRKTMQEDAVRAIRTAAEEAGNG